MHFYYMYHNTIIVYKGDKKYFMSKYGKGSALSVTRARFSGNLDIVFMFLHINIISIFHPFYFYEKRLCYPKTMKCNEI